MAAFDFPNSPSTNQTHTENSVTWKWNGTVWKRQGVAGAQGAQGHQGVQGATGSTGAAGAQGAQGRQGATGAAGAQGAQGHQGVQGAAGSATISNNADNRVITGGSGTNLNGEANLTFDGSDLSLRATKSNLIVAKTGLGAKASSDIASNYDLIQIGAGGAIASYNVETVTSDTEFIHNAYRHSGSDWKYRYADAAVRIKMNAPQGTMLFENAAAGSANANISFSERMRIEADGDIGLGTNAPNKSGYGSPVVSIGYNTSNNYSVLELLGNKTSDAAISSILGYNVGGSSRIAAINFARDGANNSGAITFETYASGSAAERVRINSSGGVVVNGAVVDPDVSGGAFTGGVYIKANNAATVGSGAGIRLGAASGGKESFGTITALHTSGTNGDMAFNMYAGSSTHPERMRLTSAGSLIIGGTANTFGGTVPLLELQKASTSTGPKITLYNGQDAVLNATCEIQVGHNYREAARIIFGRENASSWQSSASAVKSNIQFHTNNAGTIENRMQIYGDGHTTFMGNGPWPDPGTTDVRMFNGSMSVADDSWVTFSSAANTGALVCVGSYKRSGGSVTYASALFFTTYGSTTVTKISDPRGIFATSDSDGYVCCYAPSNSNGNFVVKNRIGTTNLISVNIIGLQGL